MENKIKKLEDHLNYVWSLIPNKPTYGEFNKIFPVNDNVEILRNFEKEHKWIGIAKYNTKNEGISTISLFASIVDYFSDGWRLAIVTSGKEDTPIEEQDIIGFEIIKYDN